MTNPLPRVRPAIRQNLKQARPVRLDTLEEASRLPGKAAQLLIGLWLMVTLFKSPTVPLTRRTMARVGVSRYAATDVLRRLEAAGLVVVWRLPGRSPRVTLVEPGTAIPLRLENLHA